MEKKYKHRISGDIAIMNSMWYTVDNVPVPAKYIESGNDWEEVKEHLPEYTIMEFRCPHDNRLSHKLQANGCYGVNDEAWATLQEMLIGEGEYSHCVKSGHWYIHSVRRNDGLVVSVGDKVCTIITPEPRSVEVIKINNRGMGICRIGGTNPQCYLEAVTKVLKPILTTEDNKTLYEGEKYWAYYPDSGWVEDGDNAVILNDWAKNAWKIFSTESARSEYIKSLKPKVILVTEDGKEVIDPEMILYGVNEQIALAGHLMTKTITANPLPTIKWFSTQDAREEHIIMNKPVLSLTDILQLEIENEHSNGGNQILIKRQHARKLIKERIKS